MLPGRRVWTEHGPRGVARQDAADRACAAANACELVLRRSKLHADDPRDHAPRRGQSKALDATGRDRGDADKTAGHVALARVRLEVAAPGHDLAVASESEALEGTGG